jgi:hypothetical protein
MSKPEDRVLPLAAQIVSAMRQHGCRVEALSALNIAQALFTADLSDRTLGPSATIHSSSIEQESAEANQSSVLLGLQS